MLEAEAEATVARALAGVDEHLSLEGIDPVERLRDALDLDSIDFLALVDELHQSTGIEIPESDYGQLETLAGLVSYLVNHSAPSR